MKQTRAGTYKTTETPAQTITYFDKPSLTSAENEVSIGSHDDNHESFVTLTDDTSRKVYISDLRAKSSVAQELEKPHHSS